MENMKNFNIPL